MAKPRRARSFAERTTAIDDRTGPMSIRLATLRAGQKLRIAARGLGPMAVLPLEASIVAVTIRDGAHVVDPASWLVVPPDAIAGIAGKSALAHVLALGITSELVATAARTYAGEIDEARYARYVREPLLLPRTNWVNEIAHRYLFERAVCKKAGNDATRFLETEIAKELYFLCHERVHAAERRSVVAERTDLMTRALRFVDEHLFEADVVQKLARASGASASTLLRAFKDETGDGPLAYVRARRLDEALLLLKSRRHTVSEVASLVGYVSLAAFSHAFRARFGMPPSEVRAETSAKGAPPAGLA